MKQRNYNKTGAKNPSKNKAKKIKRNNLTRSNREEYLLQYWKNE